MFVTTLLAVSLAAPIPKAKPSELYFPTVEGTKRVMTMSSGGQPSELTETYSKVVEKDGKYTVTVTRDLGKQAVDFKYEVSAAGVFTLANPNGDLSQPMQVLKLPAKEGDSWKSESTAPGKVNLTATYTAGKEEEVEVPAGKYKAIPVVSERTVGNNIIKTTTWYAAGVGVVKVVTENNGTQRVQELKEFTHGKAK